MNDNDDAANDKTPSSFSSSSTFIPPSIDPDALLRGDSYTFFSAIPPALLPSSSSSSSSSSTPLDPPPPPGEPCILGIDEAGRGPVLGPMVYGIFYLPERLSTPLLRDRHHFDDSKVLTPAVRSALLRALCTAPAAAADALSTSCGWAVSVLSARDIAAGMHAGHNLNAQAQAATVALVRGAQARGADVRAVFVDTVGPPAAYQAALARALPGLQVTVAKKADSLYPCVSAASVVAKVTRDAALEALWRGGPGAGGEAAAEAEVKIPVQAQAKRKRDEESSPTMAWGSGYPSDTRCVTWLRANMHPVFGWGPECRFSWGTAKDMLEEKGSGGVRVEWPADDDDDDHGENARVTDFFVSEDGHNKEHDDTADELASWFGTPAGVEAF